MKRLELVEMEGVSGGVVTSTSGCMNAMFDWGLALGAVTAAAQADDPVAFGIASYKAMRATEKVSNACNAQ